MEVSGKQFSLWADLRIAPTVRPLCRRPSSTLLSLAAALAILLTVPPPTVLAGETLELWVHPYLPATQIVERFNPLAAYLGEKTGNNILVKVSRDYADHNERVGLDKADIAYLGPMSYVRINDRYGPKNPLATMEVNGSPFFRGVIIIFEDSRVPDVAGLAGKSFAFGDPNSTMSYFLPRYMLQQAGVPMERLSRYEHLNSHEDVALGVIGGYFDAGRVKEEIFNKYRDRGLKALAKSPSMPEHVFVTRSDMDPETTMALCEVLLDPDAGQELFQALASIKSTATGVRPVRNSNYDIYRDILRQLDLAGGSP